MSAIVERDEAQAYREKDLISTEPITVVISEKGWIRAAKGHEVIPEDLSYRSGDSFRQAMPGRTNQDAVFVDSTGRAYTAAAHTLPTARGQGEPLTGRFNPPGDAFFTGVAIGDKESKFVVSKCNIFYGLLHVNHLLPFQKYQTFKNSLTISEICFGKNPLKN